MKRQGDTDYILGTERAELLRLGLQHQVWAEEARLGWKSAGFSPGQSLLDLGCGPGFCTQDLAYIVGDRGHVSAIDLSAGFIGFALQVNRIHALNVDFHCQSFDEMQLQKNSLDGAWCRWALAWIPNPGEIITKVAQALRPGGSFVAHEYYDWKNFQTEPAYPQLDIAIATALQSFHDSEGDINVGRHLPELFSQAGLQVTTVRPMSKLARPGTLTWQWPGSFLAIYLPKLVNKGLLDSRTCEEALNQWQQLTGNAAASCLCPQMVEVIGTRPRLV